MPETLAHRAITDLIVILDERDEVDPPEVPGRPALTSAADYLENDPVVNKPARERLGEFAIDPKSWR